MVPEGSTDDLGHRDSVRRSAADELLLEIGIESYGLDRRPVRSEPGATSPSAPADDLVHVIAPLGLIGEFIDECVIDGGASTCVSVDSLGRHCSSFRYTARSGIAWITIRVVPHGNSVGQKSSFEEM
jgi:hypothetical protein